MLTVHPIPAFNDNYIWLLTTDQSNYCAVVDPGDAAPVIHYLKTSQLQLAAILITHHHNDHTGGINDLLAHEKQHNNTAITVYGPKNEQIPQCHQPLIEGDNVQLESLNLQFTTLEVPGHTLGHIAYYGHDRLFCGDTLFAGGCGRLFEGTAEQMFNSLAKIKHLPAETLIYCAHEYTKNNLAFALTLEPNNIVLQKRYRDVCQLRNTNTNTVPSVLTIELETNPFLRPHSKEIQQNIAQITGQSHAKELEIFSAIRTLKDHY